MYSRTDLPMAIADQAACLVRLIKARPRIPQKEQIDHELHEFHEFFNAGSLPNLSATVLLKRTGIDGS
jgi:hypothetical protein